MVSVTLDMEYRDIKQANTDTDVCWLLVNTFIGDELTLYIYTLLYTKDTNYTNIQSYARLISFL